MTQQEFYDRTVVRLSDDEFWKMHEDYAQSQLDKDEYCKQWVSNKYLEACKHTHDLLEQLKDINLDFANPSYTAVQLNGLRNIRKSVRMKLYMASKELNKWRKIVYKTRNY